MTRLIVVLIICLAVSACGGTKTVVVVATPTVSPAGGGGATRTAPEILAAIRQLNPQFCGEGVSNPYGNVYSVIAPSRGPSGNWYAGCSTFVAGVDHKIFDNIIGCSMIRADTLEVSFIGSGGALDIPCDQRPGWMQ